MSEIKNVGHPWMAKCNQLIHLPFKGLTSMEKARPKMQSLPVSNKHSSLCLL